MLNQKLIEQQILSHSTAVESVIAGAGGITQEGTGPAPSKSSQDMLTPCSQSTIRRPFGQMKKRMPKWAGWQCHF